MSTDGSWTTTPIVADLLHGVVEVEQTQLGVLPHRLPGWARAQFPDPQLMIAQAQPSGVRLAFRTHADVIELVALPTKRAYVGAPPRPDGIYDLVVDGELTAQASAVGGGHLRTIDMATGAIDHRSGAPVTVRFAGLGRDPKQVEIWLPHDEATELVELRTDAPVEPASSDRPRWVHHGSSISHGSDAASPTQTWPALASRLGGVDLTNLGFSGSALLDPFVARTVRDLPADLISLKLGINLVNTDLMRLRAFGPAVHGFLDTIRDGQPTTPLLVISPTWCPLHEETPGPSEMDLSALAEGRLRFRAAGDPAERAVGKLTLGIIRDELAAIVAHRAASDPHLHLLDGRELYGEADHLDLPLPDELHPDAAAHRRMGERFARVGLGAESAWGGSLRP